jgi:hypothetical protein
MSVFKVMDGEFGTDGLISSHKMACFPTADACYRYIIEMVENGPICNRSSAYAYWVEEHREADKRSPVYVTVPYPRISQPEMPEWFLARMRKVVLPTLEEMRAAWRMALDATFTQGTEAQATTRG